MRRKQKKSLLWRSFGYVIVIIIKFCKLLLWISLTIINAFRSYIKHLKECFIRYPNTLKLVKKTRLHLIFSTHFSVSGYLMKHSSLIGFDILHLNSLTGTYFIQDETYSWQPFGTLSKSKQYWISVWNETKEQQTGKKGILV